MEFNEKLQELRKQKGLTQEDLAERLYVSRTAVSKWESGRGYPNIDSLKEISKYFSVSIDDCLDDVLQKFSSHYCHMAIARDEKGKVRGMLTLEDIIEEIVGEINDEFDEPDTTFLWGLIAELSVESAPNREGHPDSLQLFRSGKG